jgi:hypothetical protein
MASRIEIVERELDVRVPQQYATFLEKHGIFRAKGRVVYGIHDKLLRYDGSPCVIGVTQSFRRDEGLPHSLLVIEDLGVDGVIICLDTEDEKVYQISRVYGDCKIADSFDEWFEKEVLEYLWQKPPSKYAGAKLELIYDPNEDDWE